ncbi:MAG: VOC family protein [Gemmatimonadaceae bacterium]
MPIQQAIPALPVRRISESVAFYNEKFGFAAVHVEASFAVVKRDDVELHLWLANDEGWRQRAGTSAVQSGAESFIAGTASCRIRVTDIDALHAELAPHGVIHPNGALASRPWGDRDFATLDAERNLITFFQRDA